MMQNDAWFFDRDLMSRYFDALLASGINTWVLANTHPFPFMVDMSAYPDAVVLSEDELARYQAHYHWLFDTALSKGLYCFVLFHTCYVPDAFGLKHGIKPEHSYEPPPLAYEYTRYCVRQLCDTYPELTGIYGEASENVHTDLRGAFANKAIVAAIHGSKHRPILFFRGWISDPAGMKANVMDAYEGECFFNVKYTWEHLVDPKPDPEFMRWVDTCGADRVMGEFWISNFQPFGCHDTELAAGIRDQLHSLGCPGFTSHPMDLYGAPFVQSNPEVLQIERDYDWYSTLAGTSESDQHNIPVKVAARPLVRASCFMTGNKQNFNQPQLLAIVAQTEERQAETQTFDYWYKLPMRTEASFGRWVEQLLGTTSRYPGETEGDFGLPELIAELNELETQWIDMSEDDHDPVTSAWRRDVQAQHEMARAWVARARAVDAHDRGDTSATADGLRQSLDHVRKVPVILDFDGPYRLLIGRHTFVIRWSELIDALAAELADFEAGRLAEHYFFGTAEKYDEQAKDAVDRDS